MFAIFCWVGSGGRKNSKFSIIPLSTAGYAAHLALFVK
jgi:hypothetical protein